MRQLGPGWLCISPGQRCARHCFCSSWEPIVYISSHVHIQCHHRVASNQPLKGVFTPWPLASSKARVHFSNNGAGCYIVISTRMGRPQFMSRILAAREAGHAVVHFPPFEETRKGGGNGARSQAGIHYPRSWKCVQRKTHTRVR